MNELIRLARGAKVYDLAQPYYVGMPHHPVHPPYLFGMTKKHGDYMVPGGVSSAADGIAFGGHVGTHIDALCHFSCGGKLHDGSVAAEAQSYGGGMERLAVDGVAPMLRRGVLLDIAGLEGVEVLPVDFSITPAHLDAAAKAHGVEPGPGDVAILRTGWAQYWGDAAKFIAEVQGPGPEIDAARWLSSRSVFAAGSDTVAFELVPARSMPVHVHLLVERGIHIVECLNMEQLAADRVYEFLFVAAPLRIQGGTGSPIRPLAVVA